ncbi:MAG: segregation/condensation protein A [Candidatus Woesearchaeota archaeon]
MRKKLSKEEKLEIIKKKETLEKTNDKIFSIIFVEDELSWKDLIYKLINEEQMDPWNIDISILAQKFLEMLKKLKELDFRISGKMILASAILLKMKSEILIEQDIPRLDGMINNEENILEDENYDNSKPLNPAELPKIYPRTPQPRKRKVSVYDLVNALEKALEVESRRKKYVAEAKKITLILPEKKFDLGKAMLMIYKNIEKHYSKNNDFLTFDKLVPSDSKIDKVTTFVPLLHLDTQRKIDLEQKKHFDTIYIKIPNKNNN